MNSNFFKPIRKRTDEPPLNEQKQMNLKLQMLEEKLKNSETKRVMLDAVNRSYLLDDEIKNLEKMKGNENDPNTQLNLDAISVLKEIREEITKKLSKKVTSNYLFNNLDNS